MLSHDVGPDDAQDDASDIPSVARIYDYFLGGYHNFAADREVAAQLLALAPETPQIMRANRAFLRRAVTYLAGQGIAQFLDIGSGIPTIGNVHEIVLRLNPAGHVVYVDSDAIAVRHSHSILRQTPTATAIQADARQPEEILRHPEVARLLDFGQPVAVLLFALLHFVPDDTQAYHLVRTLRDALPSGGYLALSHGAREAMPVEALANGERLYARTSNPSHARSQPEIASFFEGLRLVEPGLVYVPLWRPESAHDLLLEHPERSVSLGGVGIKP